MLLVFHTDGTARSAKLEITNVRTATRTDANTPYSTVLDVSGKANPKPYIEVLAR